jgi:hypothetical protein
MRAMPEPVSLLLREFLTWIAARPRTYADAMEAWRSNCPGHTVWEDALLGGLIGLDRDDSLQQPEVTLTPRGRAILEGMPVEGQVSGQLSPDVNPE